MDVAILRAIRELQLAAYLRAASRHPDGTRLDDAALRVVLGVRLRAEMASSGKCECGYLIDSPKETRSFLKAGPWQSRSQHGQRGANVFPQLILVLSPSPDGFCYDHGRSLAIGQFSLKNTIMSVLLASHVMQISRLSSSRFCTV